MPDQENHAAENSPHARPQGELPGTEAKAPGVIEGGEVTVEGPTSRVGPSRDLEKNRSRLATSLVVLLGVLIFGHYASVLLLEWNTNKRTEALSSAFNATLPVISGLVASAVTYYFTRNQRNQP
jgi:hypothetical protein